MGSNSFGLVSKGEFVITYRIMEPTTYSLLGFTVLFKLSKNPVRYTKPYEYRLQISYSFVLHYEFIRGSLKNVSELFN